MNIFYRVFNFKLYLYRKFFGILAQLGEHLPYKQRVTGSSPVGPINAGVAELADAQDLKSCGTNLPYRFDSGRRHLTKYVCVAQLDRALGYGPRCREFESSHARCSKPVNSFYRFLFYRNLYESIISLEILKRINIYLAICL